MGRAVGTVGASVPTSAFLRWGTALGGALAFQVFLSTVGVLHHWDSVLECMPWDGWQGMQVVSEAQGQGRAWGQGWHWGRPHTHQQARAVDQMKVVVKGLLALLPGGWGLGCWGHQPQSQLLEILVPSN